MLTYPFRLLGRASGVMTAFTQSIHKWTRRDIQEIDLITIHQFPFERTTSCSFENILIELLSKVLLESF